MTGQGSSFDRKGCDCSVAAAPMSPLPIGNDPALGAIHYRVGTHSAFKRSLLQRLSTPQRGTLNKLQTRRDDDFSVALLDCWATVADVMTFYQERIANECFLRCASEPISLRHLARLIGYDLRAGVAASAFLAFTLEESTDPASPIEIGVGTKVQSVPGQGEQAEFFETIEDIKASPQLNCLRPRRTRKWTLSDDKNKLFLKAFPPNPAQAAAAYPITNAAAAASANGTPRTVDPKPGDLLIFLREGWKEKEDHGKVLEDNYRIRMVSFVDPDYHSQRVAVRWLPPPWAKKDTLDLGENCEVFLLRQRASMLGATAPDWKLMSSDAKETYWENYKPENPNYKKDWPFEWPKPETGKLGIDLDGVYRLPFNSLVLLVFGDKLTLTEVKPTGDKSVSRYGLSAKLTSIQISDPIWEPKTFDEYRKIEFFLQSERIDQDIVEPDTSPVEGSSIELEGTINDFKRGQLLIVEGIAEDEKSQTSEVVELSSTPKVENGVTKVEFVRSLGKKYKRESVTIYGNVALATHGETTQEVLGSGNASIPFQKFTLKQPPLTFVSAPTSSGAISTLEVRVNDVLWHEVESFRGHGPDDRVFVTRGEADGTTTVIFGDGRTGARLPTGQENVRASYRRGIGSGGQVRAGQLSLLMTRPLGVKSVINPLPASGAQDPETVEEARRNAPLTVQTLDRLVSLADYESFALAFAGIAKALATWSWVGQARGVFITVAGLAGAEIPFESPLCQNLLGAMRKAGDPYLPLDVRSFTPAHFSIKAGIQVHPDFIPDRVILAVTQELRAAFSFGSREFGQWVRRSEVYAVMQAVPGVVAVDLDQLYLSGKQRKDGPPQDLAARLPYLDVRGMEPAELLVLDEREPPDLRVMA